MLDFACGAFKRVAEGDQVPGSWRRAIFVLGIWMAAGSAQAQEACSLTPTARSAGWRFESFAEAGAVLWPFGDTATITADDGAVRLWDIQSGRLIRQMFEAAPDGARTEFYGDSSDGRLGVWTGAQAGLYDMRSGALLTAFPTLSPKPASFRMNFSPSGNRLVAFPGDGTMRLIDTQSGRVLANQSLERGSGEALFSKSGSRVVVWTEREALLFDAETGRQIANMYEDHIVERVAISVDGERLVVVTNDDWAMWDVRSGARIAGAKGEDIEVEFSPDGAALVIMLEDGTARLLATADGRQIADLRWLARRPYWVLVSGFSLRFSPDGKRLVTRGVTGTGALWDVATGRQVSTLGKFTTRRDFGPEPSEEELGVYDPAPFSTRDYRFSADGTRLLTIGRDNLVSLWNAGSGAKLFGLPANKNDGVDFSDDGRFVTMFRAGSSDLRDTQTGKQIARFGRFQVDVAATHYSPDGRFMVLSDYDHSLLVDFENPLTQIDLGHSLVSDAEFSPDSRRLIFDTGDGIALWDLELKKPIATKLSASEFKMIGGRLVVVSFYGDPAEVRDAGNGELIVSCGKDMNVTQNAALLKQGRQHLKLMPPSGVP